MMMTSTREGKPVPSHLLASRARRNSGKSRAMLRVVCDPRCVSAQARCTTSARRW